MSSDIPFSGCYWPSRPTQNSEERSYYSADLQLVQSNFFFKSGQVCPFIPPMSVRCHLCKGKTDSKMNIRTASGNKRESPDQNPTDLKKKYIIVSFRPTRTVDTIIQLQIGQRIISPYSLNSIN